jgi:predicted Kef-type K+ transport protein
MTSDGLPRSRQRLYHPHMPAAARLRRSLVAAFTAAVIVLLPGAVGSSADTTPAPTTTPTTPLTITLDPMGDLASPRLAKMRGILIPVRTSAPATIRVELLVPRSVARALGIKVPRGATRVVAGRHVVTATQAGDLVAYPQLSKRAAERLAAKRRAFPLLIVASSGTTRAETVLEIKKRD